MRLLTSSPILLNFVLFLSLLSTDEEAEEAAAAESNALSAGGRKVGDQHMAHSPSVGGAGAAPRGSAVGKPLVQGSSSLTQLASPSAAAARLAAAGRRYTVLPRYNNASLRPYISHHNRDYACDIFFARTRHRLASTCLASIRWYRAYFLFTILMAFPCVCFSAY